MKSVDGDVLEGGGQILRNAIALSCLLKVPTAVKNVRAKRNNPGLRPQHLTGIQLVCEICSGRLTGAEVGSREIIFEPGPIGSGKYLADTKTAGSVGLLIQVALPCLAFGEDDSIMCLKGGTNAEMAPPIDFFIDIFIPVVKRFGLHMHCDIVRRGFYPKGGGEIEVIVNPVKELLPIQLTDFGQIEIVRGNAYVAGALPIKFRYFLNQAIGTGCGITLTAVTSTGCLLSGSAIGKKGIPSEQVGASAAEDLLINIRNEACIDDHLQDQLIIFMALATGKSAIRTGPITLHTKTAIHIAETLTEAKFTTKKLKEKDDGQGTYLIECTGIGHQR